MASEDSQTGGSLHNEHHAHHGLQKQPWPGMRAQPPQLIRGTCAISAALQVHAAGTGVALARPPPMQDCRAHVCQSAARRMWQRCRRKSPNPGQRERCRRESPSPGCRENWVDVNMTWTWHMQLPTWTGHHRTPLRQGGPSPAMRRPGASLLGALEDLGAALCELLHPRLRVGLLLLVDAVAEGLHG
eukprot:CAMPEP_0175301518 /NCGR_PEP_ID=MMETSP0093-20121207/61676_1 /TAXON_ID=311494 /ORGANISM="Alexandrium monilatum, Strain CCMP3105" /LENGTH=186 /DNA_ID=CAMNT_0016597729 /DNA_START=111 /DNA_END=668 /DNA_ORIENTATION=-